MTAKLEECVIWLPHVALAEKLLLNITFLSVQMLQYCQVYLLGLIQLLEQAL